MARLKGLPNPAMNATTFRAHGVRLDVNNHSPHFQRTCARADEICKRVSALLKAIEASAIHMNEFEQAWGLQTETVIYLYDDLAQQRRLEKYWGKKEPTDKDPGWRRKLDPLSDYHIVVSFLSLRDESVPSGKLRSLAVWLYDTDLKAPLGNIYYPSQHFVF